MTSILKNNRRLAAQIPLRAHLEPKAARQGAWGVRPPNLSKLLGLQIKPGDCLAEFVAPSDIISNLFLEDLERIQELKKWIPDPCNPYLHYLKPIFEEK